MENEFNNFNKEFLEKKYEIENRAKQELESLKDDYLESAKAFGYAYDDEKGIFTLDSDYAIDYQICSFGRAKTKPEFKLVHNVLYVNEEQFFKYAEYLENPVVSYLTVQKAKALAQVFATDINDFYYLLKRLSETKTIDGGKLLIEQGFTSRAFTVFYPSGSNVFNYYSSIKVINYYGGFSFRMNNLAATFHLYQVSNDSKPYIDEYLANELHGKFKESETYFGINNPNYVWVWAETIVSAFSVIKKKPHKGFFCYYLLFK